MSDDSDEEKTEEPTEQRLRKAKEDGQVARSRELTTFMLLVAGVGGLWLISGTLFEAVLDIGRASFAFDPVIAKDPRQMLTHVVAQAYAMVRGIALAYTVDPIGGIPFEQARLAQATFLGLPYPAWLWFALAVSGCSCPNFLRKISTASS